MRLDYFWVKVRCKIIRIFGWKISNKYSKKIMKRFYQKNGIHIGNNCAIFSDIRSSESCLISIGNNVTISNEVLLVTHDNCIDRILKNKSDIFGRIVIGDNCFIGMRSLIMPGVTLGDKIIVGAGSVVTKSFKEQEIVIAGNPARIIGKWNDLINKYEPLSFGSDDFTEGVATALAKNPEKIINDR